MYNVVGECAGILNVSVEELKGDARNKDVSLKRKLIWYKLRLKGYGEKEIGHFFNRSKSTICTGVKSIEGFLFWNDKQTRDLLMLLGVKFTLKNNKVVGVA